MIFADTHVLIWLASGDARLPELARDRLLADDSLAASVVTAFEFADLQIRGRLPSKPGFAEIVREFSLEVVDLPASLWTLAATLPPIHGDPIDRMLIAHAMASGTTLATADENMRKYPVNLLW